MALRTMTSPADLAVRVYVRDTSGRPVSGAFVEAVIFDARETPAVVRTGGDGSATLRVRADAKVYNVLALKPGAGMDYFENYQSWPPGDLPALPPEIHLVLDGARGVQVRAVDSADRPVPNVALTPWTIKKPAKLADVNCSGTGATCVFTDTNGIALFSWVPSELGDAGAFLVRDRAYHCPHPAWIDPAHPDQLLTARLLRNARVGGRVLFPDGRPAPGIVVQAEGRGQSSHYCRTKATSGPDGTYDLVAYPNQSYVLAVVDTRWAARSIQGVVMREGDARKDLDLLLVEGARLRGRVTLGPDCRAAPAQTITVIELGGRLGDDLRGHFKQEELVRWAYTDASGCYELRLGPGRYRLEGPPPGGSELVVLEGQEEVVRDFHMPWTARGVLTGEVRRWGRDGSPVANARVWAESVVRGHAGFGTFTDGQGRFSSQRWRDRMVVYARDQEGPEAGCAEIGELDDVVTVEISDAVLARGRVVGRDGSPLSNENVFCRMHVTMRDWSEVTFQFDTRTDVAGSFALPGLLVGSACDVCVLRGHQRISAYLNFRAGDPGTTELPDITL
jgi:hypothetical protein